MITVIGSLKGGSGKSTITFNLAIWLALAGQRVAVIDADPQATLTDVLEVRLPRVAAVRLRNLDLALGNIFAISVEEGAQTAIYLACSPEVDGISGKYFYREQEIRSSKASYDPEIAQRLWSISEDLTGLS